MISGIFGVCLAAYFVGVVIRRFVNASVGDTIEVIAAVLIVLIVVLGLLGVRVA